MDQPHAADRPMRPDGRGGPDVGGWPRARRALRLLGVACALGVAAVPAVAAPAPPPVSDVVAADVPGDAGGSLDVEWTIPAGAPAGARIRIERSATEKELRGDPTKEWIAAGDFEVSPPGPHGERVDKLPLDAPVRIRVALVDAEGAASESIVSDPVLAARNLVFIDRLPLLVALLAVVASVATCVALARAGRPVRIRRIAALEAVDEAVGRATEMGREILFVPGIQDMNDIQTVAGMTVLGRIARTAAEYDASLVVPTCRSIVMTAARETVQAAHYAVGRPETYREANVNYVTDEQFGYVAYLAGRMVRERPAACFYMGAFYAESLILAENGNSIGAIQIAGTAEPSQLPFFVAACDYTLIGEEFFAASAYLSGERDQLGSIKGQDVGKAIAIAFIVVGSLVATAMQFAPYLREAAAALIGTLPGA